MHLALRALERDTQPTPNDWRIVSDAINLMETMVTMGHVQDTGGLLADAVAAMAVAGARHVDEGKPIRLSGEGMQAVRAVLEDYAEVLRALPERVLIECHRLTERRIQDMLDGRGQAHDVTIVEVSK